MTARNPLTSAPPYAVEIALKTLGANLRTARLRRRLTAQELGERIGVGRHTVADAERGKPSTAVAVCVGLLWALGLLEQLTDVAAPAADAVIRADADMLVALDRIADPGNLGTIIRTAEAAGSRAVILLGPSVDPWGPKVVRASAGSVFRVPVVEISAADLLVAADSAGLRILAADVSDGRPPWDVLRERRTGLLWVFGSESHGLSADLLDAADTRVTIPMAGAVESVNLAASVAVCLFSQARERMTD